MNGGKGSNFVGTTAEWNALTDDEKAKYDTVDLTDDAETNIESGGHTIVNSSGTDMTQRAKLKFINATVSDDSENDSTIVTVNGSGHTIKDSGNNSMTARTNLKFANAAVTDDSTNDVTIITVKDIQVSTMPTANAEQLGRIVQYIGNDSGSYTHGYFYEGSSYVDSQSGDTVYTCLLYTSPSPRDRG